MVSERPRDDDDLVDDDRLDGEESGGEDAGSSSHGGRLGILRRLPSVPWVLSLPGRVHRPAMFGGAVVTLLAWTWMLWQLVAATTEPNASVESLAAAMQQQAAPPASAGLEAPPAGHSPDEVGGAATAAGHSSEATAEGVTFAGDEVVREDAPVGGEPRGSAEPSAAEPDAVAEGPVGDEPIVIVLGKPAHTGGADLWDCLHFESWDQTHQVYRANLPQDPNILDFDGNGVPCESLPGAP